MMSQVPFVPGVIYHIYNRDNNDECKYNKSGRPNPACT